jgi:hypothetical protein
MEWIYCTDWCYANRMTADDITVRQWLQLALRQTVMKHQGGLLHPRLEDVGCLIDGSPFPQIITAKLETFLLQARRVPDNKKGEPPPLLPRKREIPQGMARDEPGARTTIYDWAGRPLNVSLFRFYPSVSGRLKYRQRPGR